MAGGDVMIKDLSLSVRIRRLTGEYRDIVTIGAVSLS
jgi:hypothetical protein